MENIRHYTKEIWKVCARYKTDMKCGGYGVVQFDQYPTTSEVEEALKTLRQMHSTLSSPLVWSIEYETEQTITRRETILDWRNYDN